MYTPYEVLKFWLPIVSAFGLVIKAYSSTKKSVQEFAERLLNNHLSGIENATQSTEVETKKTNALISAQAGQMNIVQNTLVEHHEKSLVLWQGVLESLAILKERTRVTRKTTPKRKASRGR